MTQGKEQID